MNFWRRGAEEHLSLEQRIKVLEEKIKDADAWGLQEQIFALDRRVKAAEKYLIFQAVQQRHLEITFTIHLRQHFQQMSRSETTLAIAALDRHTAWAEGSVEQNPENPAAIYIEYLKRLREDVYLKPIASQESQP